MVDIAARASAKLEGENMRHGTMHSGSPTWVLTLNKYQRDNLLFLLNMCGYPGYDDGDRRYAGVEPFTIVHNGDWLGEIALMLSIGRCQRHARPLAAPRACAQVWPAKLENQVGRAGIRGGHGLT